jgi:NAD-dependent SIR2 family protein deacetylase
MNLDDLARQAADAVASADALLITAGAGIGVDSGLPDFRGPEGFWRAYPAIAKLGLSFEMIANPSWFTADPHLAWAFYGHRLNLYRKTDPHPGFTRLLEAASNCRDGYFIFTSNVDGQFQKAGFDPNRLVECHGSIHHLQCARSCSGEIWDASGETLPLDENAFRAIDPLPRCPSCSALARPNILMFGDWKWLSQRTKTQTSRFDQWLDRLTRSASRLAVIEIGAGTAIPTVRLTSEEIARKSRGTLIRINPRDYGVPSGHIGLPFGAAEGIKRVLG